MADLFQEKGPLVVYSPEGGRRLAAEIFRLQDITGRPGIVYFDVGWYGSFGHPVHVLEGDLTGDGPWEIEGNMAMIDRIDEGPQDDELRAEWKEWARFKRTPDGAKATRAYAEQILRQGGY